MPLRDLVKHSQEWLCYVSRAMLQVLLDEAGAEVNVELH